MKRPRPAKANPFVCEDAAGLLLDNAERRVFRLCNSLQMILFARKHRARSLSLQAMFFLLAAACWGAPPDLGKVVVQLPYTHQFEFAGFYAAQTQGYFREEGLEVEIRPDPHGQHPVDELHAGRAQYGVYQAMRVLHARLSGEPLVVMAAVFQHSPYALATLRGAGIRNVQDLVGRKVAIDPVFRIQEIQRMLINEGVDPNKVLFVPNHWDVNELKNGTADAMGVYLIDGPYDLQQQGCDVQLIRPSDYGVDFYGDVLFTNEQELRAHPQRVKAMRRAALRGWEYALRHQAEMIDWILQNLPERPKRVTRSRLEFEAREVARLVNLELIDLGSMNPGRWRVQADFLATTDKKLQLDRLPGFIYLPATTGQLPSWVIWLGWVMAVIGGLALLVLLEYYRMQRLVRMRTAALNASEERQRELFEEAPAPIVVESYLDLLPLLERYRREGVKNLRAHLAANPALISELFAKKRVISANRQAREKVGFLSVQEMDHHLLKVQSAQSLEMFVEELVAIWEGVDRLRLEKIYHSIDGGDVHTLLNWEVSRKQGQPDFGNVRLVFTDISDLKMAEQGLRASEERYRTMVEQSPLAIAEMDFSAALGWFARLRSEGVTDLADYLRAQPAAVRKIMGELSKYEVNEACVRLFGARSREELQQRISEIHTPDSEAMRLSIFIQAWRGGYSTDGECTLRRLDGREIRARFYSRSIMDARREGQILRTQTILLDITEQRRTEQFLRESETRYRELFENAVGGVYRSDLNGSLLSINPAFSRLLGYEDPVALLRERQPGFASTLYVLSGRRQEFISQLRANGRVTNFESEVRARGGGTVWISENARAVLDAQGQMAFIDGFVTDITARRRLEAELLRASKLEAVGILAGGIAHDFNNILTVVLGNVTLAEMDTYADPAISRMLRDAKQATLRARDLTQQLLTFAKGGDPVRTTIALTELIRESTGFAMHGAKARPNYDLPDNLWPANADKGQIGQVVQNLVINGVQAMPQGGTITLRAANVTLADSAVGNLPKGDYIRLSVGDTGVGIASDHLTKIFDPYFTTKQTGSGLGLATVYSIIRKHQGHIEVESQLGVGTTFHLWLPAAPHAKEDSAEAAPAVVKLQGRILFMDDEEPIRDMAGMFMERLGLQCDLTIDGAETVAKYRTSLEQGRPYNLVIMDLTVPGGMGGREAMEELKALDPAVLAVVSSGYSRDPVLANFRAHGFSGILPKPYTLDQLQQTLRNALGPGHTRAPF